MTRLTDQTKTIQADATSPAASPGQPERRRPGRIHDVNPALIPLLRRNGRFQALLQERDHDDLRGVRGVALSVVFGALAWGTVGLLAWWLLSR